MVMMVLVVLVASSVDDNLRAIGNVRPYMEFVMYQDEQHAQW